MSDISSSLRRNPSPQSHSGPDTPSSDGGGSHQSGSQSQASTAQTTPASTPFETAPKPFPTTIASTSSAAPVAAPVAPAPAPAAPSPARTPVAQDPLRENFIRHDAGRRSNLEDATRITHATQGPRGALGLLVAHKSDVQNELNAGYTRLSHNLPGSQDTKVSATVERNTINLAGTTNVQGGTVTTGATSTAGFTHLNSAFTSTDGTTIGGLIGASGEGTMGTGLSFVRAIGTSVGMGGSLIGLAKPNAQTNILDVREQTAGVEHEQSTYLGGQAVVTVGAPVAGVAMRVFAQAEVVRTNQEDLPIQEAKTKINQPWIKRKLMGLGLLQQSSSRHGIDHNEALARGKKTSEERHQNLQSSMAVSLAGVHLGIHSVENQNSKVALSRSNSGNSKTLTVSRTAATTEAKTLDVPVLASGTQSSSKMQATQVSLQLPDSQDAQPLIRRSKSVIALNQSFELPVNLKPEEFQGIENPLKAIHKIRETEAQNNVSIEQFQHSIRKQKSMTRGSVMPLGASLFGPLASLNTERGVADVYSVAASKDQASIISGNERTFRTGIIGRGDTEETASFLQIKRGSVVTLGTNENERVFDQQAFSVLVAKQSIEQANVKSLRKLDRWSRSFSSTALDASSGRIQENVERFSATALVTLLLEPEDKLSLYEKEFFPSLAPRQINDATQRQQVLNSIDQKLTEMVGADTDVVQRAALKLGRPNKLQYDFEVTLVDNLAKEANRLAVEQGSPGLSPTSPRAIKNRETFRALYKKTEQSRRLMDMSVFKSHPEKREQLLGQLSEVQAQILQTAKVSSSEELFSTATPSRQLSAQTAREALAAPAEFESSDGDLGLIRMRTLETR